MKEKEKKTLIVDALIYFTKFSKLYAKRLKALSNYPNEDKSKFLQDEKASNILWNIIYNEKPDKIIILCTKKFFKLIKKNKELRKDILSIVDKNIYITDVSVTTFDKYEKILNKEGEGEYEYILYLSKKSYKKINKSDSSKYFNLYCVINNSFNKVSIYSNDIGIIQYLKENNNA